MFTYGTGLQNGRFEWRNAKGNNLAITAATQIYHGNFKSQLSGYLCGTVGEAIAKQIV